MPAREAIAKAGFDPDFDLGAKDASALINGSTDLARARRARDERRAAHRSNMPTSPCACRWRPCAASLPPSIRACTRRARIRARPSVARNLLRILEGTKRCSQAARDVVFPDEPRQPGTPASPRVQDVYSLRCTPQVHGPAVEAVEYVERIIGTEINSATDNPLIFDDGKGGYVSISGGHFHGQYMAQAMDVLSIAMADLGAISERRLARLIDPTMSYGLPRNLLAGKRGLNTGFATVQCWMSALVMENRGSRDAGLRRFHPWQIECRGSRRQFHLVRAQGAHHRRERRADRRGRIPDGRAGAYPGRADRQDYPLGKARRRPWRRSGP